MTRIDKKLFVNYPRLGRSTNFGERIIQKRIQLVKRIDSFRNSDLTLVDVGCGTGTSVLSLANDFKYCIGIDVQDYEDSFARIKTEKKISNCEFKLMDIEKDKIEESFDRIICFEVIEHLKNEKSVKYLYDLLKSGGKAAISVPNKWWIFETHGAKLPFLRWNRAPFFSWLPTPIHEKFAYARIYTKKRISKLLRSVGFEIANVDYITAPLDVLKNRRLKSLLLKYIFRNNTTKIPFLSTSIFIHAEKPMKS